MHQLHGHSLATSGFWTFTGLLNGPSHVKPLHFLATSCTPKESNPACATDTKHSIAGCRLPSSGTHVKSGTLMYVKVQVPSIVETGWMSYMHVVHLGSGITLLVLVTMPLTDINVFRSSGFRSLMTFISMRLKGRTCVYTGLHAACGIACTRCVCMAHHQAS